MNRVGLKDYLLNHADDNDLLDCAKAWDAANEYGQFDTYKSVEEAAEVNGWDAAQALGEAARVDQSADNFRLNDMCEDRCEVAAATQSVEVSDRGQVGKKHDDSEIGE